jgi:hypothetical protein
VSVSRGVLLGFALMAAGVLLIDAVAYVLGMPRSAARAACVVYGCGLGWLIGGHVR